MSNQNALMLPILEEFELPSVSFKVLDPSSLSPQTLAAFDDFMRGAGVPHRVFVYSHDYARFCMLVKKFKLHKYFCRQVF